MNRGSYPFRAIRRQAPLRFNEAPIHESGKSGRKRSTADWKASLQ